MINSNPTQPQEKPGRNWWRIIALVSIGILALLFLGKKVPSINLGWLGVILALYFFYLGYKYYVLRLKQPNLEEMIKIVKKEASKRNITLYDGENAVLAEPVGEFSMLQFTDPRYPKSPRTFILKQNIVMGVSALNIQQLKQGYQRSRLLEEYARRGIVEDAQ